MHILSPENWVKNYADYMFSYAFFKTNDREAAQDLVQDTFLSALKVQDGFKGDASEKTWLLRILNNKIIDFYRQKRPIDDYETYLNDTEQSFQDTFFAENEHGRWTKIVPPMQYANAADDYVHSKEFQAILNDCLVKIPTKIRQIFVDKYIDDKNATEICTENNISNANYWVIIHRAKVLLRTCLERNYEL